MNIQGKSQYREAYARALSDPEGFWAEAAREIDWISPAQKIFDPSMGLYGRWFAGAVVTYPVPLALLAACFSPGTGLVLIAASLAARLILKRQVDRAAGAVSASAWLLPVRDCLSFAAYGASFFVRSVDWRGARLKMQDEGRIAARPE